MGYKIKYPTHGSGFQGIIQADGFANESPRYHGCLLKVEINRSNQVKPPKDKDDYVTPCICTYEASATVKILLECGWVEIMGVNWTKTMDVDPADLNNQKYKESQEYGQMEDACIETARMMALSNVIEWLNA